MSAGLRNKEEEYKERNFTSGSPGVTSHISRSMMPMSHKTSKFLLGISKGEGVYDQGVGHKDHMLQRAKRRTKITCFWGNRTRAKSETPDKGPTKITRQRAKQRSQGKGQNQKLLIRVYVQLCTYCLDKHLKQQKTGFESRELVWPQIYQGGVFPHPSKPEGTAGDQGVSQSLSQLHKTDIPRAAVYISPPRNTFLSQGININIPC